MDGEDGAVMMVKKAEIDTSSPFRSVKEAVMLFGERFLAGELYSTKLKEVHDGENEKGNYAPAAKVGKLTAELEEAKESLEKAREESIVMATCLSSLQDELERTKRELQKIKERESEKHIHMESSSEIDEELKFTETSTTTKFEMIKAATISTGGGSPGDEFQKKRYVTFANPHISLANPPSLSRVVIPKSDDAVLDRHPSLKKKKKKPLIPLIGGIFSRKKGSSQVISPRA